MGIYPIFIHFYCAYCTINTFLTLFHTLYFTFLLYILFSIPLMFLSLIYQLLCIKNDSEPKAGVIFSSSFLFFNLFLPVHHTALPAHRHVLWSGLPCWKHRISHFPICRSCQLHQILFFSQSFSSFASFKASSWERASNKALYTAFNSPSHIFNSVSADVFAE